ncbi:type IX secretion system membrane protein PorP/SprF [Litoribacter ruber]|uniref:Type IX secretion system membrane protein PorP/SprF n=1 Tax=Litoribacter ruber TaxID=702568 RepID=A0AAP2CFD6_9BACT|nr:MULTISPECIES: type IX secretion system membrane protein PorP/SprF [Litoribacter]MBS9523561.1 type IX secretion system membrane protein PorP/SprF [Litoribacter alkaliphilus]MBT0812022.1 type IX secretion system membrane protein PorP/SprF [Litoribacter ruber]
MKKILLLILLLGTAFQAAAQDVQYSQFYANPMYLNPAFAGSSEVTRVGVNYRNQWPGLDHSFNSYTAYIDHYMFDINSGIGLIFNGNRESMAHLSTMEVGAIYSYRVRLNMNTFLRFGGQVSYVGRDVNFNNLVFGSQLDIHRGAIDDFSGELLGTDSRHRFADFNFGMLLNGETYWVGISGHHVTQPNQSFLDDNISRLPMKLSAHGGIRFDLGNGSINNFFSNSRQEREISFAFNVKHQDPFNQLDIGTQIYLQPMVMGLWYRGLPSKYSLPNNESIVALFGFSLDSGVDIGYSFDFTTSKLGLINAGGAHEISIRYSFLFGDPNQRDRRSRIIPCFRY